VERLVVSWATAQPDRLAARLAALGFTLVDRRVVDFPAGQVRLVPLASGRGPERLLDPRWEPATGESPPRPGHANGVSDIVALGWATVDADRASAAPPIYSAAAFTLLPDDGQLGASVRGCLGRRAAVLLLEPATEGRLAATLARLGEGPAALYLVAGGDGLESFVSAIGATRGRAEVRPGPLGPALLLPGSPAWGPHLLVVTPRSDAPGMTPLDRAPGTISP